MVRDQAHVEMNEHIEGYGGGIGITYNSSALINMITAGPAVARIIDEFETTQTKQIYTSP